MSRREARKPESRRSYSKTEREPSPKRSRRDGKPKTERNTLRNSELETIQSNDQDRKLRGRLQDTLPLEVPIEPESKAGLDKSELKKKTSDKESDGIKHSIDPPRSRSFFQHDERSIAGQGARSLGGRATTERGWWNDSKGRPSERHGGNEMDVRNPRKRDERTQAGGAEDDVWRHDRFQKFEDSEVPPARKRPQFREKKIEHESRKTAGIAASESGWSTHPEQHISENARKEEWAGRRPYESDRLERPFTRDRAPPHRRETQSVGFSSNDRFGGGGGSIGREGFSRRYGERNQVNNIRTEKWKHDMFDEANKSPSPKTAEDQIAKIEALLAS